MLIEHTLMDLQKAGVTNVVIVLRDEKDKLDLSGLSIKINYVFQKEAKGMGNALLCAKEYLDEEFFLLNAYHFDFSNFSQQMLDKKKDKNELVLLLKKSSENFERYGAPIIDGDRVLEIIEKPTDAKSEFKVIGIYLLNLKFLEKLEKLPEEHYVFEKAISEYAKENRVLFTQATEETLSLKYPWDLFMFSKKILDSQEKYISDSAEVSETAVISGNVFIDDGAKIMDRATIKGPCYIGKNVVIGDHVLIREYSNIEENCVIGAFSEIKNSIIQSGTKMHSGFLGDSIVGRDCRIAAYFSSANRRLDKGEIKVNGVGTGVISFGVLLGDKVNCGVRVNTMPGVMIGNNSIIGPSTTVEKDIAENTRYFVKATEVVEKAI